MTSVGSIRRRLLLPAGLHALSLAACSTPQASATTREPSFSSVPTVHVDSLFPVIGSVRLRPKLGDPIGSAYALAVTRTQILIADSKQHNVKVFDRTTGALVRSIGRSGDGPGEFRYPGAIEVDAAGRIRTLDFLRSTLALRDSTGTLLEETRLMGRWTGMASLPGARRWVLAGRVASEVDANGQSETPKRVHEIDSTGTIAASYRREAWPRHPWEATYGNAFVAASKRLVLMGTNNTNLVHFRDRASGREWSARFGAPWYRPFALPESPTSVPGKTNIERITRWMKQQVMMIRLFPMDGGQFIAQFRSYDADGDRVYGYVIGDTAGVSQVASIPGRVQLHRVVGDTIFALVEDDEGEVTLEMRAPRPFEGNVVNPTTPARTIRRPLPGGDRGRS